MRKIAFSTMTVAIAMLLLLTIAAPFALPSANAQHTKATYAHIGAMPNPVGIGQQVLLWLGISDPLALETHGWEGLTITVTKPNNTTEILGPFRTDSTGSTGTIYVPDMVGNYTLQTHFPAQSYTWPPGSPRAPFIGTATYLESNSEIITLVVQEQPVQYYPGVPLPSEYWTRPIDAQLREWYQISANWVAIPMNFYAPFNDDAPETAHVLWSKPLTLGGLAGGSMGDHAFIEGDAYQGMWANSVIIGGILYYNRFQLGFQGGIGSQGIMAVDLRTGEEIWFRNNTRLDFGQTVYWDSFNMHGVYPYVWEVVRDIAPGIAGTGRTWQAFDAYTGEYVYTIANVPAGASFYGQKGEILKYVINTAQGWIALFNTTKATSLEGWTVEQIMAEIRPMATDRARAEFAYGSWIPFNRTINGADPRSYSWNVSIPRGLPGAIMASLPDRVIGSNIGTLVTLAPDPLRMWGISTAPETRGQVLFNVTWPLPPGNFTMAFGAASPDDGVFVLRSKDTRQWWGFSLDTGQLLWGPTERQVQLDIFDVIAGVAYGKLFSTGMGGVTYAYDIKTGALIWKHEAVDPYSEILWSNNWPMRILFITDGKIYIGHEEHSPVDPKPRGAPFYCLDAETGEVVWSISGAFRQNHWGGRAIIGDSIMATFDTYDNQIYAVGKGPTALKVAAPSRTSTLGGNILITGTVMDVSAGTKSSGLMARFPNGVPAVSDESMSDWMLYVYKQFPRPTNVTGVDVTFSVLDPNGNMFTIGTVTSDSEGEFSYMFTPEISGKHTIMASFTGSGAYWPSHAQTTFEVVEAGDGTPGPTPTDTASMTDAYVIGSAIAIILAIAIVGALLLRRRP